MRGEEEVGLSEWWSWIEVEPGPLAGDWVTPFVTAAEASDLGTIRLLGGPARPLAFAAQPRLGDATGARRVLTDESWAATAVGQVVSAGIYAGERDDARRDDRVLTRAGAAMTGVAPPSACPPTSLGRGRRAVGGAAAPRPNP
ncbi:hypothetical protein [Cellulomonas sp. KRMCY2]|uniref:hypothetical protein n=1 Tax=Cellulomonas sp. KRMCY2 TaxID=1304865 RepID=UPI00045E9C85|nr:hypothetical protein [Cellulomonas sp. KRMCY2]